MLVQKLRIYAMLMLLQELEQERLSKERELFAKRLLPDPIIITTTREAFPQLKTWCDKKGKPFEPPKSKYHK